MKTIKEALQPAENVTDKEKAMERVVELLVKAFPEAQDVAEWIADAINILSEVTWGGAIKKVALDIIGTMTQLMLLEFIEAKTDDDKINASWEFIGVIVGNYFKEPDLYIKAIEKLDSEYTRGLGNDSCFTLKDARIKVYQFDALKEVGKLIKEPSA